MTQYVHMGREFIPDRGAELFDGVWKALGYRPLPGSGQISTPSAPGIYGYYAIRSQLPSAAAQGMGAFRFLPIESDATRVDVEQLICIPHIPGSWGARSVGFFARGSGADGAETAYLAYVDTTANLLVIAKKVAGVFTSLGTAAFTPASGGDHLIRFQVIGTALKLRAWIAPAAEPATWAVSVTDSAIAAAGWSGPLGYNNTAGAAGVDFGTISFISVGTGGDAAATPITEAAFDAWMADDSQVRAVLAEMGVLGQNALGAPNPSKVFLSTCDYINGPGEYNGRASVPYDSIILQAPKFTIAASEAFTGRSSVAYGDLVVSNEGDVTAGSVRDAWLRWNWGNRTYDQWIGNPFWPRWDFRRVLSAVVDSPYMVARDRIGFKIRDRSNRLTRQLQTNVIGGTGPNAGALAPITLGYVFNIAPVLYDGPNLIWQFGDKPLGSGDDVLTGILDVRDSGVSLAKTGVVASVDAATDTLTVTSHGGLVGAIVYFSAGTPVPTPVVTGVAYYIAAAGFGANTFKLQRSDGTIVDLTTTTAGGAVVIKNWKSDYVNCRVQLLASPAGQVTMDVRDTSNNAHASIMYEVSNRANLPPADDAFANLTPAVSYEAGLFVPAGGNGVDIMDQIATSAGGFWFPDRLGRMRGVRLDLPQTTYDYDLNQDDLGDSIEILRVLPPADNFGVGYFKNYAIQKSGLAASVTAANVARYGADCTYAVSALTFDGLDQAANNDAREISPRKVTLFANAQAAAIEADRLTRLRSKAIAVFAFSPKANQMSFLPGDRVRITHSRFRLDQGVIGVIVGLEENAMGAQQRLQWATQWSGEYPATGTSGVVSEKYFY